MQLVKTLSAIALFGGAIPSTFALSVKDDQLSVNLKFQVQERAYLDANGKDAAGNDYDPLRGTTGQSEFARFDVRRARLGFAAKYGDAWTGNFQIRCDGDDRVGANGATNTTPTVGNPNASVSTITNNNGRTVQLYYANAARIFKIDDDSQWDIHGGLDKPFNTESSISSTAYIMPQDRWVAAIEEQRGVGLGLGWRSPWVNAGFDLQNNLTTLKDPQAGNNTGSDQKNGYLYNARVEFSPGKEYKPKSRQESYTGKEGTGLVLGFDVQSDQHNLTDNNAGGTAAQATTYNNNSTTLYGPDLLVHWNYLTFLAEYRWRKAKNEVVTDASGATATTDLTGKIYDVSLGWAFPVSDMFLEPCARYSRRDFDKDTSSTAPYGNNQDNAAADGKQWEIGLNLYINGHNNKIQLSYQNWKAESGDAKANIIRLQHQWAF